MVLSWGLYHTGGQHFTLDGGLDRTDRWIEQSWGQIAIDLSSLPAGAIPGVTATASGWTRRTYVPSGYNNYAAAIGEWTSLSFTPTHSDPDAVTRLLATAPAGARPRPQPAAGSGNDASGSSDGLLGVEMDTGVTWGR